MTDEYNALDNGIAASDGPEKTREYADVAAWKKKLDQGRKHDEDARKQYAKDRRYARGDSGFKVDSNLIGTNIDILESFLYAKDPDVDAIPAKNVQPPGIDSIREAAEEALKNDTQAQQLIQQEAMAQAQSEATMQSMVTGGPQGLLGAATGMAMPAMPDPEAVKAATEILVQQYLDAQVQQIQDVYAKQRRDADSYAETIEIVVSHLWRDAGLKPRGRRLVRSGLTIGVGIIKSSWQERTAPSPETVKAIADLQDNIKRAASLRADLEEQDPSIFDRVKEGVLSIFGQDSDAKMADYQRQLAELKGQAEQVVARGFVIDLVRGEDFQIPPGWELASHVDAPWNAHRIPMLKDDAKAHFGLSDEDMKQATCYSARKPVMMQPESGTQVLNTEATDADAYQTGEQDDGGQWVMPWEIWDRNSNTVLTMIEGIKCWVKPAWKPTATTRFYPFFLYTTSEVDGQRHPQSLVTRSAKLVDEYNRIGSAEAEHRSRIIPKLMFNAGQIDEASVKKLTDAVTAEFVPIKPTMPNVDMRTLFSEVNYPAMNEALYDRSRIVNELERIWGIQEALSGAIETTKTATEAEIQQSGFTARTGGRRDLLENMLQDMALYTAEVARANLEANDVRLIAGPDSLWPEYKGAVDLSAMVKIEIRAGSSGKPNTTAERNAWAQQLPLLQNGIIQIGQMRNSTPLDIANCLEKLLRITAERSGDRLNMDQLIPKPGPPLLPMPVAPGAPAPAAPAGAAAAAPEPSMPVQ